MRGGEKFGIKVSVPKVGEMGISRDLSVLNIADENTCMTPALQGYEYRITHAIQQLLHVIQQHKQQPINMTDYFTYFAFDVMEDLAFNQSSNMVKTGKAAYVLETIRQDMYGIALFSHLPWLLPLVKRTPFLNRNYLQFWDWIQKKIDQRTMVCFSNPFALSGSFVDLLLSQNEPDQPDIFSWILSAYQSKSPKTQTDHWNLHGDAQLIVIAGSDSVAASLTHIFCELACRPELVARLQAEFDSQPGDLEHDNLIGVELLDAVIHETMRLHPPVPSGTQRVTPEEGLRIGKEVVPGGVIVQIPSYTVFRGKIISHVERVSVNAKVPYQILVRLSSPMTSYPRDGRHDPNSLKTAPFSFHLI